MSRNTGRCIVPDQCNDSGPVRQWLQLIKGSLRGSFLGSHHWSCITSNCFLVTMRVSAAVYMRRGLNELGRPLQFPGSANNNTIPNHGMPLTPLLLFCLTWRPNHHIAVLYFSVIWVSKYMIDDRHRNPNINIREIIWLGNQLLFMKIELSVINLLDLINSLKSFYFPIFFIHFSLLEFPIPTRIRSLFVSSNCPETLKICNCSSTIQYLWKTTLYGFGCH